MSHLTEEQLVLHYYGEEGGTLEIERHLDECEECRALLGSLQRALNVVDSMPSPERGVGYGTEVWRRIEGQIPARPWWRTWMNAPVLRWSFAGAGIAAMLAVAFFAGRFYPNQPASRRLMADHARIRERVLLVAVGDYLDRSQMVLVELANVNTNGPLDISPEQERAEELISETRLYRQTASTAGAESITGILDDLEPVLLDLARGPSRLSPVELEKFRARLEDEGILFKIRVVNSNVRSREIAPAGGAAGQRL